MACRDNDTRLDSDPSIKPKSGGIPSPAPINYTIVATHPHDSSAYTQGLIMHEGKLYEGTGDYEESSIRITDYKTGAVVKKHMMGTEDIFGEGITILNGKLYQLTWQNNFVNVYDPKNITKVIKTFKWPYEGWGITNNGKELIISDGTSNLYFVNPETFTINKTVGVQDNNGSVRLLNELEWINGFIYANIYTTSEIVKKKTLLLV